MPKLVQRLFPVALTCALLASPIRPVFATLSFSGVATSTTPVLSSSTAPSTPATVFRVPDRPSPYGPDFYRVVMTHLYHVWGTANAVTASIDLGPAPSFLVQGKIYVKDKDLFYLRDTSQDLLVGKYTPPYQVLDLRTSSHMSAQEIDDFIRNANSSSPLFGLGAAFMEAQQKYGVNAQYLAAHAILESNWGTSAIAQDKHNLFGFQAYDDSPYASAAYFPEFRDSILYVAYYVRVNYLDPTGRYFVSSTLQGMNVHYATDPDWGEKIASVMQKMRVFQDGEYNKAPLLALTATPPAQPSAAPPTPTTGPTPTSPAASRGTNPSPTSGAGLADSYPPGTLGRVATDALNFRAEPSTQAAKLTVLSRGTPLVLIGKNSQGWYQAKTQSNTGWVYGNYIDPDAAPSDLPANTGIPRDKTWTIHFNLPLSSLSSSPDVLQSYVSVVNAQDGFVPIQVVPGPGPDVLLVRPPSGGYLPAGEYYLYIYKGLAPKTGAALPGSVRMKFTVKAGG